MNINRTRDLALAIAHSANAVEDLAFLIDKDRDEKVIKARLQQARQNLSEAQRRLDALSSSTPARQREPVRML